MNAFLALSCLLAVAQASHVVHHSTHGVHGAYTGAHVAHHAVPHHAPVVRAATEYVSPAAHLVRAPQHDSALIESSRYGGNFAYKTVEKPAYAEVRPVIRKEVVETGVSYSEGPAHVTKHVVPQAPVVHRSYETVQPPAVVSEQTHYRTAPAYYGAAPAYGVHHGAAYGVHGAAYGVAPAAYGAHYGGAFRSYGAPVALGHYGLAY